MKRFTILFFLVLSSTILYSADLPFGLHEKMVFEISGAVKELRIKGVLGMLTVEVRDITYDNNRYIYHCSGIVETTALLKNTYTLQDQMNVWFDSKDFKIQRIDLNLKEGKFISNLSATVDYKNNTVNYTDKKSLKTRSYPKPPLAFDILTFLYYLRNVDKNKSLSITLIDVAVYRKLNLSFSPGKDVEMAIGDAKKNELFPKKQKYSTIAVKETGLVGMTFYLGKNLGNMPLSVDATAFEREKTHFVVQGRLVAYSPGDKVTEEEVKKAGTKK